MVKICKECKQEKDISKFYKKLNSTVSYCDDCCKQKAKKYAKDRVTDGRCRYCSNKRLKTTRYCLTHLVKRICDFHRIDHSLIPELIKKLHDQKFQCYYTGILLIPGSNLSIDHIIPKKTLIDNSIDNLVWCDLAINKLKQDTEVITFLERNKEILDEYRLISSFDTEQQKQLKLYFIFSDYSFNVT